MVKVVMRARYINTLLFVCFLACGILIPASAPQAADISRDGASYIAGFESLPLMPGLTEKKSERVNFDTPVGRIVEATTVGRVRKEEVEKFYTKTLPQLGWQKVEPLTFKREGERLSIEFLTGQLSTSPALNTVKGMLVVRFTIKPLAAP